MCRDSLTLSGDISEVLAEILEFFCNNWFMLQESHGFSPYATSNAFDAKEASFNNTVRFLTVSSLPHNANTISSHVIYKVKITDDHILQLSSCISRHFNKDSDKVYLRRDCSMCSSAAMRIILSMASLFKCRLTRLDVKPAFIHTIHAEREVYVHSPLKY